MSVMSAISAVSVWVCPFLYGYVLEAMSVMSAMSAVSVWVCPTDYISVLDEGLCR